MFVVTGNGIYLKYMDLEYLKNYTPSLKETNVHMLKSPNQYWYVYTQLN